jgi:DNA-binding XRE family transcriptional regulator
MPSHLTLELRRQLADSLRESLRTLRRLAELSQAKMAQRLGMGATAYGRFERGSQSLVPSTSMLRRMYQAVPGLLEPECVESSGRAVEPSSSRRRSTRPTFRRPGTSARAKRARRLALLVELE